MSWKTLVTLIAALLCLNSGAAAQSSNYFTDLNIGPAGILTGGAGDRFIISGNFSNASTQNVAWSTSAAELAIAAGAPHAMSLPGSDQGPSFAGYVNNFAWGVLHLMSGQSVSLSDGNATPGAALYTETLILADGIPQIGAITGNGCNIYYNPYNAANSYLGGLTYPLAGGGAILPVAAVLKITAIMRLPNGHILLQCLGAPNRTHSVQVSADLVVPFALLASVTAAADGTFQFEDVNAPSFGKRFYRLAFP